MFLDYENTGIDEIPFTFFRISIESQMVVHIMLKQPD